MTGLPKWVMEEIQVEARDGFPSIQDEDSAIIGARIIYARVQPLLEALGYYTLIHESLEDARIISGVPARNALSQWHASEPQATGE